jgi:hypothetical protein
MVAKLARIKMPADFHVDFWPANKRPAVAWTDAERRYHFWLNNDGTPHDDVLHSNPITASKAYGADEHRSLSLSAKKWAPLISAMLEKIARENLVADARVRYEDSDKAKEDKRVAEYHSSLLAALDRAATHLPVSMQDAIAGLPKKTRVAFMIEATQV